MKAILSTTKVGSIANLKNLFYDFKAIASESEIKRRQFNFFLSMSASDFQHTHVGGPVRSRAEVSLDEMARRVDPSLVAAVCV